MTYRVNGRVFQTERQATHFCSRWGLPLTSVELIRPKQSLGGRR